MSVSRRTGWILSLALLLFIVRAPEVLAGEATAVEFYARLAGAMGGALLGGAILYYLGRGIYRVLKPVERKVAELAAP